MRKLVRVSLLVAFVAAAVVGSLAWAGKKPGGGGGTTPTCPKDFACPDVWDPVVCADGVTYSNQCYADLACAPGPCTPTEGGPIEVE
jgi:hypothetical protein